MLSDDIKRKTCIISYISFTSFFFKKHKTLFTFNFFLAQKKKKSMRVTSEGKLGFESPCYLPLLNLGSKCCLVELIEE